MATPARLSSASSLGWADLGGHIQRIVQERGLNLQEPGRRGLRTADAASAQAETRLFGSPRARVILYRDNHAWCPYCHKVWMQLEEKRIPYRVEKVAMNCYGSKRRDFLKKTPRGLLPAVEIDGDFMVESSKIMEKLEERFPEHKPMMLPGSARFLDLERELFGAWLNWLRGDESARARAMFVQCLDKTDQALASVQGPFFHGNELTLPDCVFASSLERMAASMLYYKGLKIRGGKWTNIEQWFQALEMRDGYKVSRSDYHTHCHNLPPQIGGCIASGTPEQRQAAAAIDGTDGSWTLPLKPLGADALEPAIEDAALDKLEAAAALVHCQAGVQKAAGADKGADAAYRQVVCALVSGVEAVEADVLKGLGSPAAKSLRYTRDRISVPRDMSYPAARQLRAHLNFVADTIDPRQGWQGTPLPVNDRRDTDPQLFGASL